MEVPAPLTTAPVRTIDALITFYAPTAGTVVPWHPL